MSAGTGQPPFASDTLARLYLAQGHFEVAWAMAEALQPDSPVRDELARVAARRRDVLTELLERVRARREERRA